MKQIPNIISFSRGFAAIALLFTSVFSVPFWIIYGWCGLSDMIDGPLARKLGTESRRGAMIDSISDFIFVIVAAIKLFPAFDLPVWIWLWIAGIATVRVCNLIFGYLRCKKIMMFHTPANRITGLLLFLLPAAILMADQTICSGIACLAASLATVQESFKISKN